MIAKSNPKKRGKKHSPVKAAPFPLDQLDREILYALDENGRRTTADISRLLGEKRDRITYRIRRLEEEGVILGYEAVLNPYKLGLTAYKTYLRIRNDRQRIAKVLPYLQKEPHIHWVAECEGTWDFIFVAFADTPKRFHLLQNQIFGEFKELIIGFSVYTLVDVTYFRRGYLLGDAQPHFSFGGWPEVIGVDSIDLSILELIAADCRLSATELSSSLSLSAVTVSNRLERLEERQVILGYRAALDTARLGMAMFKIQIHLQEYSLAIEKELLAYCMKNPFIALYIQQLGDCKIEMEVVTYGYEHLNEIRRQIREKFPESIRQIDATYVRDQRYTFTPYQMALTEPSSEKQLPLQG